MVFVFQNWALRYDADNPVQPRYDLNAPDLYIPTMAYITYVVLAGFVLGEHLHVQCVSRCNAVIMIILCRNSPGMQQRFTPEDLGKQSSTALAVLLLEIAVYSIVLYVTQIPSSLKTLDLVAYAGYKFVPMVSCIVVGILFNGFGYWLALFYCNAALAFFMMRSLYMKLKSSSASSAASADTSFDAHGANVPPHAQFQPPPAAARQQHDFNAGRTRKLYFTGFLVAVQLLVTWWLTRHLIAPSDRQLVL